MSGVVLGSTSIFEINGTCATNASWNANPNAQRFYCLDGNFAPIDGMTIQKPTITLDVTVYAPGPVVDVSPSTSCTTQDDVSNVSVNAVLSACGEGSDVDIPNVMMVTSYNFNKEDNVMPGEESWSLQAYVGENLPTYVIRGLTEGTATDPESDAGIVFDTIEFTSSQGNVSAEGIGQTDRTNGGIITQVGGGTSSAGVTAQGSASIQYNPLWL